MRILVADAQKHIAELVARMVNCCDHETVATVHTGGLDVIAAYDRLQPDVVILDIPMHRLNGLTTCHVLMSRNPTPKILFLSGQYDANHPFVQNSGASGFLPKPATMEQLRDVLASFSDQPQMELCAAA